MMMTMMMMNVEEILRFTKKQHARYTVLEVKRLAVNHSAVSRKLPAHIVQTGSHIAVVPVTGNAVLAVPATKERKKDREDRSV